MVWLQRFVPLGELPVPEKKERHVLYQEGGGKSGKEIVFLFLMNFIVFNSYKGEKVGSSLSVIHQALEGND